MGSKVDARRGQSQHRQRSFFGKTRDEARRKMLKAQRLIDDNLPIPSETLTVAGYLQTWLAGKKDTLAPESYRRYEDHVRLRLTPELGKHKLAKLQPMHVRAALSTIRENISHNGTASPRRSKLCPCGRCPRDGLITRNVASSEFVTAPRRTTEDAAIACQRCTRLVGSGERRTFGGPIYPCSY